MNLLDEIRSCTTCAAFLPHGVRPVLAAHPKSRLIIIGQAPGRVVHESGVPWDDKSGENLRNWLEIDKATFYDPEKVALIPMGFCYPGTGKSGDLPPRKECAPQWHPRLWSHLKESKLTLLIGQYAQRYYLGEDMQKNLTQTVQSFEQYAPDYFPLPHPSPRNNLWQAKNPWFGESVLPALRTRIKTLNF